MMRGSSVVELVCIGPRILRVKFKFARINARVVVIYSPH